MTFIGWQRVEERIKMHNETSLQQCINYIRVRTSKSPDGGHIAFYSDKMTKALTLL